MLMQVQYSVINVQAGPLYCHQCSSMSNIVSSLLKQVQYSVINAQAGPHIKRGKRLHNTLWYEYFHNKNNTKYIWYYKYYSMFVFHTSSNKTYKFYTHGRNTALFNCSDIIMPSTTLYGSISNIKYYHTTLDCILANALSPMKGAFWNNITTSHFTLYIVL